MADPLLGQVAVNRGTSARATAGKGVPASGMPGETLTAGRGSSRQRSNSGDARGLGATALTDRGLPRPDVMALADQIAEILKILERNLTLAGNPGLTADLILSRLVNAQLTPQEVMALLGRLKETGCLTDFISVAVRQRVRRLWYYLRDQQVSWAFITLHWEPSAIDSANYFTGFIAGAAGSAVEGVVMLAKLLSLNLLAQLAEWLGEARVLTEAQVQAVAEEREAFFLGLQKAVEHLLSNPVSALIGPLLAQREEYRQKLYALQFYDAGVLAGKMVLFIVSIPTLFRSILEIPKLLKSFGAMTAIQLARLLPIEIIRRELKQLLTLPPPRMLVTYGINGGRIVMALDGATETVGVFAATGEPLGAFPVRDMLAGLAAGGTLIDDIEEAANAFETPEEGARPHKPRRQSKAVRELPEEPTLSNPNAPYEQRVAFIEQHRHLLTPENGFSARRLRNLEQRIAKRGDLTSYEKAIDHLLKRDYITQLKQIVPFPVVQVQRIATRGVGRAARGGEMEQLVRSLRTGQQARISWTSRTRKGAEVQIDDLRIAGEGPIPSEIKSGLRLQEHLDLDFEGFLDTNSRKLQAQMLRHAEFATDWGLPYYEWVAFSEKTAAALERVYRTLTKAQQARIKIVLQPFFE